MDNNKTTRRTSGATLLLLIAFCFFVLWFINRLQGKEQKTTYAAFTKEVSNDNIEEVSIEQNKEVPTGVVSFRLKKTSETKTVNVSDINEVRKLLDEAGIEYA